MRRRQKRTSTTEHSNVRSGGSQKLRGLNIWAQLGGNKLETADRKKKKQQKKTGVLGGRVVLNKLSLFSETKHTSRGLEKAVLGQRRRHCRLGGSRVAD